MTADSPTTEEELPTVLVVDDNLKNLLALETVLENSSFRLIKAQTGSEALLALMNGNFAAIVLDVQMPDMSGIDLARMIKERKRTQHIPIIFLTAHFLEEHHAVLGYDVGAVDYLTKPINPAVLRSKINVFVDLFRKTRALAEMNMAAEAAEEALRVANMELAARNQALESAAEEHTRRINAEFARAEAEEANAAKDRFLAMLSHELRTPLSPIMHAVTLLEEGGCPPELHESIATIRRNVRLEKRLIDDLLDLARIRNGKLHLNSQSVDVHEMLRHAVEICLPELDAHHMRVEKKLEALHTNVLGDPARLQQVFWNLLTNAVKFSPEGSAIEVRTSSVDADSRIRIEIADKGVGIPPEKLESIFGAFEQGEDQAKMGLGLGLSICKALVELHGGAIVAQSDEANGGATFVIDLPCAPTATEPIAMSPAKLEQCKGMRLLVVEDHLDTLHTLERLLVKNGYVVRTASSIAQALEITREYEYDVLVSDIGLPDGRGTDLMERLGENGAPLPPAIAMSGFGMENDLERSLEAGFSEHLTKPVEFLALHQAISRLAAQLPQRLGT